MKASEVKLKYVTKVAAKDRPKIESSRDANKVLRPYFKETMEHYETSWVILLNRGNKVLGVTKVGEGGRYGCVVDQVKVMQGAILANASGIILAHNHPSGKLELSESDKKMNANLKEIGCLLDIPLMDSLIMTKENYYSCADEGTL